jgi:hypothetical protein
VLHEACDFLSSVKDACMSNGRGQTIRLGEHAFATFKILKPKAFDVCSEELELAKAVVGMAMETSDKRPVLKVLCALSKWTGGDGGTEFAAHIVPAPQPYPKHRK